MKRRILVTLLPLSLLAGSAQAVDLACGAYLCSSVGFVAPGCSAVRIAMYKRLWHLPPKSPVPSWGSCVSGSENPSIPEGLNPQEQADALALIESMAGTETTDVYSFNQPRATLIYAKTWDPAKGGQWVPTPDLSIPPRIIHVKMEDLTDDDLLPLYQDGPPWMGVAKLKGVETSKNGVQYGPTHWLNSYGRNFYDNNDYNEDPLTGEIEAVPSVLDISDYMTPEQMAEDTAQLEEQRSEIESADNLAPPVSVTEPEQSVQSIFAEPEGVNNREVMDALLPEGVTNDELINDLRASMAEPAPEGVDPAEWLAYLQAAINDLEK